MTRTQRWTIIAAVVGSSGVFLDTTVVNVALPSIGRDLPRVFLGVLEGQTYVYNAYLLSLSALLILAGAVNDFFGRRRTFLVGLTGFGTTSALCALAPTMELLVAFRILEGAAAAILVPSSLSLLTAAFSGEQRGRAIGIWAGASAVVFIAGPFIGGATVALFSWRVIFFLSLPIVAIAAWATLRGVEESRDEGASGRFDWRGAVVLGLGVGGLSFGAVYGQQRDWQAPLAYAALLIGAAATLGFPWLMTRTRYPLVPLALFRSRNFTVTNVSTFLIYSALYLSGYYQPLFTQGVLGYDPPAAGAALLAGAVVIALFSSITGALAGRYGPRRFMVAGPMLMAAASVLYARVPADSPALRLELGPGLAWLGVVVVGLFVARAGVGRARPAQLGLWLAAAGLIVAGSLAAMSDPSTAGYARDFLPAQLIYGTGSALMVAPLTTALMGSVPVARSGLASAINNAVSRVGPQLTGAVLFIGVTATFYATLAVAAPQLDVTSPAVRGAFPPLNPPVGGAAPDLLAAARNASTAAFHFAMALSAALLVLGGLVNAVGIRDRDLVGATAVRRPERAAPPAALPE